MRQPKFEFSIDCPDMECDIGRNCSYGLIYTDGDTLEELMGSATISIIDQDGGEKIVRADAAWMQEAIEAVFWKHLGILRNDGESQTAYFNRAALEVGYRDVFAGRPA